MKIFDYQAFFDSRGVEYHTSGKNVGRGELAFACPWCGDDDPSWHMNVNPVNGMYSCWRNRQHKGKSASKLVQALIKCSWNEALQITNEVRPVAIEDFAGTIKGMIAGRRPEAEAPTQLDLPIGFRPIKNTGAGRQFVGYLERRGFDDGVKVSDLYDLHYSMDQGWLQRIILPILATDGVLSSWVGRSIREDAELRYKALSVSEGALRSNKDFVWLPTGITDGGPVLIVCEGPFDALKLDYYGSINGVRATCLFGLNWSESQVAELFDLTTRFERTIIMFDKGERMQAVQLLTRLNGNVRIYNPPFGAKDAGELTGEQVNTMVELLLANKTLRQ